MNKALIRLNQMISDVHTGRSSNTMNLMNDMLYLMSQGCNLSSLAGSIIKLLPTANLPLKKVVCAYLIRYSGHVSDLSILTTNSLRKDSADPNPHVRKLAIKTSCCVPCLKDLSLDLLPSALQDPSAHVRRTAAAYCPKVISVNAHGSADIIEQLYGLLRDENPLVVTNALLALDEILEPEGGVVINYKMARYLVGRMTSFPNWCISAVCGILKKYDPKNENEALELLNILDSKLSERRPMVLIPVMDLVLSLIQKYNKNLETDIIERVQEGILSILSNSCAEVVYIIIEHMKNLLHEHGDIFSRHYKEFLCNFNDPISLKIIKLSILPLLLRKENCIVVVEDTVDHLTDCKEVSKQAVITFAEMLRFEGMVSSQHIEILLQLMTSNHNNLFEEIVISLSRLDLGKFSEWKNSILLAISEYHDKIFSNDGKNALLHIICNYGANIENVAYILEKMVSDEDGVKNEVMYILLLTASVKVFCSRPAEMQLLLGKILQDGRNSSCALVRAQAIFYNSLLELDPDIAAKILDCQSYKNSKP